MVSPYFEGVESIYVSDLTQFLSGYRNDIPENVS